MNKKQIFNIIGIMTGTSMDGIDISYISTDGINKVKILKEKSYQYSLNEQIKIKKINIKNQMYQDQVTGLDGFYLQIVLNFG